MLRALCLVVSLLVSLEHVAWAAPRAVERFALVIGNNLPLKAGAPALRYADDDAVATHRLLLDAGVYSVLVASLDADTQRMHGRVKAFAAPNGEGLERAYAALLTRMQAARARGSEVDFLFFYSGHGDVDRGEGFLLLENGRLTRSSLFALLLRSPATRNHVFIDSCKSYFVAFDRGPGGQRESYSGPELVRSVPAELDNTGFVLSTSSDRESHEWERFQGGILSHELRSALRGAADADLDRNISYAEIGAFLKSANESIPNPSFRPDFLVRAPAGNLRETVLSWSPSYPTLSFRAGAWGHFYIETARGDRLLDAHPAQGQALMLWVPEERPLFVRQNDGRAESVVSATRSVEVSALTPAEPVVASRGALSIALDQLFEQPFDDSDVRRFERAPPSYETLPKTELSPKTKRAALRWTSGGLAVAAAAGGLTFSGLALVNYARGADASQERTQELNDRVGRFNRASAVCYGVAALSGAIWWLAKLPPNTSVTVSPTSNQARFGGMTLDIQGRF